jgi:hypothetical protein
MKDCQITKEYGKYKISKAWFETAAMNKRTFFTNTILYFIALD